MKPNPEELKPCPFCGGIDLHVDSVMIACNYCVVQCPSVVWNTRTPDPSLLQELEELRKDRERLDWMDKERVNRIYTSFKYNSSEARNKKTWREAIDSAMTDK